VFTARYELSPYIKQIRFVFKGLIYICTAVTASNASRINMPSGVIRTGCNVTQCVLQNERKMSNTASWKG
jgi:hypothetical protein